MEKCLDLALRTEGAAGSDAPTIDNYPAPQKGFVHYAGYYPAPQKILC